MAYDYLAVDTAEGVRSIRLNRPEKRNALSMKMRDEIEDCLRRSDADAAVRCAVIGGGAQVFSAGFDLEEVVATRFETFRYRAREFSDALYNFSKPLVAAVSGPALAGGFDLALAADFIVASPTARFGHPEVNFGAPPSIALLWTRVGIAKAKELAMLGDTISADEAYRIGLANRVVAVERLMDEAVAMAKTLAAKPPAALRAIKAAGREVATLAMMAALRLEADEAAEALADPDNMRRAQAYFAGLKAKP